MEREWKLLYQNRVDIRSISLSPEPSTLNVYNARNDPRTILFEYMYCVLLIIPFHITPMSPTTPLYTLVNAHLREILKREFSGSQRKEHPSLCGLCCPTRKSTSKIYILGRTTDSFELCEPLALTNSVE